MSEQRPLRIVRIVAANTPGPVFAALGREDWRACFDVFEFDVDQLAHLHSTGVLEDIETQCEVWIDIYEETEIKPDKLDAMLDCILRAAGDPEVDKDGQALLQRLSELAWGARERGVPVWMLL
jgi:hypothetical protein